MFSERNEEDCYGTFEMRNQRVRDIKVIRIQARDYHDCVLISYKAKGLNLGSRQ
jgi:hypothetical protein